MDLGYVRTVLVHATAIHGIVTPTDVVFLARTALRRLGLIGKARERDRRPTQEELDRIIAYAEANPRQMIPLGRMVRFAVATAMRLDEICQLQLEDIDPEGRIAVVRDRKDPRYKVDNHHEVPLLDANGYAVRKLFKQTEPPLFSVLARLPKRLPHLLRAGLPPLARAELLAEDPQSASSYSAIISSKLSLWRQHSRTHAAR